MKQRMAQTGRLLLGLVLLVAISGTQLPALAGENEAKQRQVFVSLPRQVGPTDPVEVETWLDDWAAAQMEKTPLYSLGFVMVKDGELFFAKGYGADPLTGKPFVVETSTVRVASVAKLFTATAVMQLYDRGLIALHDDVNQYLTAIQLEDTYSEPVTFHHLLTHTEGFERWFIGVRPKDPGSLISLEEFYTTRRAKRILPPGRMMTYDNYTSGLLGYLIEQVSGMSFTDYMAENIFAPLGMESSTFVQPPPPDIRERVATEYEYDQDSGAYSLIPERLSHLAPAGGMHTNLLDMGNYMIAMLGDGSYQGGRVMSRETVQMMYLQRYASHPSMPGMAYGLFEAFPNGHRVLRRDGDSMNAWSRIYLIPDEGIGLFFTAIGDEQSRIDLSQSFFDRFYPRTEPLPRASATANLDRYRGVYHSAHDTQSTYGKTIALITGNVHVKPSGDGTLAIRVMDYGDSFGGFEGTTQWVEVEPNFFQRSDGNGYVAFGEDENGRVTHMYSAQRYMGGYRRVAWYETPTFHYALMGIFMVVFLFACIAWGIVPVVQTLRRKPGPAGLSRWGTVVMGVCGTLGAFFSVMWFPVVFLIGMQGGEPTVAYGVNTLTKIILVLPLLITPLALVLVYFTWQAWKGNYWSTARRVHYTIITVATLGLLVWANYWNLFGFRF